ncbi:unnamed protein product [Diamesa serratosioi]
MVLVRTFLCLKLNGTCPVVENTNEFICTDYFKDATIRCQLDYLKKSTFQIELTCTAVDDEAIEFCATSVVDLQNNTGMAAINYNYFLEDEDSCFRVSQNFSVVKAVPKKYIVFYGCQEFNGTHIEAAWIFGYQANQTESLNYLDEAFQSLRNTTAKRENFSVFNLTTSRNMTGAQCGCDLNQDDPCEYYTRCKLDEYEYYYYYYDD